MGRSMRKWGKLCALVKVSCVFFPTGDKCRSEEGPSMLIEAKAPQELKNVGSGRCSL